MTLNVEIGARCSSVPKDSHLLRTGGEVLNDQSTPTLKMSDGNKVLSRVAKHLLNNEEILCADIVFD